MMLRIRPEDPERRTETGDTTGGPGRRIQLEEKEALEGEVEVEAFPAEVEEDSPVEVGDEAVVVVVEGDLKTEADTRREGRTGGVETVAARTMPTGWNVSSARRPSLMSFNLQGPTPLRRREMRSS